MSERDPALRLQDMAEACRIITALVDGLVYEQFAEDRRTQHAIAFNIMVIGEAAKNVSPEILRDYPEVSWREAMRMRDRIAHGYYGLLPEVLWQTAIEDCPQLAAALAARGITA